MEGHRRRSPVRVTVLAVRSPLANFGEAQAFQDRYDLAGLQNGNAYGVACVLATQNPMDLDYRALGNAGVWCLGRLQTDADRERVMDGLGEKTRGSKMADVVTKLAPRWFVTRDARDENGVALLRPRDAMSYLRGPMTRVEIKRAVTTQWSGEQGGRR